MSTAAWPSSPLDAAQRAFELLVCQPAPLAFDTRPFAGLPDEILPLDELRDLLLLPATGVPLRDAVWRELVTRARRDGPAWVVAVVGMALPGLRRMAGLLAAGWRGDTADLLVGFVERLKVVDLDEPRICGRLIDAGVRAARKVRDRYSDTQLIRTGSAESRLPTMPWDHPDLVLARAVAAGVLEPEEAALIGATRLGRATLAQAGPPSTQQPASPGRCWAAVGFVGGRHRRIRHPTRALGGQEIGRTCGPHMDVYRAAARLVVAGKETAAFTLCTNPPKPLVGEATAVREAVSRSEAPARLAAIAELAGIKDDSEGK